MTALVSQPSRSAELGTSTRRARAFCWGGRWGGGISRNQGVDQSVFVLKRLIETHLVEFLEKELSHFELAGGTRIGQGAKIRLAADFYIFEKAVQKARLGHSRGFLEFGHFGYSGIIA